MINMTSQLVPQQGTGANTSLAANQKLPAAVVTGNKSREVASPEVQGSMDRQSVEELAAAVNQLNEYLAETQRGLRFSIDDDSGRTIVHVVDTETDEVIRQIPSEEMLVLSRYFNETAGNIINEVA